MNNNQEKLSFTSVEYQDVVHDIPRTMSILDHDTDSNIAMSPTSWSDQDIFLHFYFPCRYDNIKRHQWFKSFCLSEEISFFNFVYNCSRKRDLLSFHRATLKRSIITSWIRCFFLAGEIAREPRFHSVWHKKIKVKCLFTAAVCIHTRTINMFLAVIRFYRFSFLTILKALTHQQIAKLLKYFLR